MPGNLGVSGLSRWAGGEKPAFVFQEFSLPESTPGQKLSDFPSALVKQTQEQKGKVKWYCHKPRFAISGGCFSCLPGNYEVTITVLLKSSWSAL